MVASTKASPIADRLQKELGAEFELHKNDETTLGGFSDLPAGINGGVAQLVDAKVDEYKEGDNKGKLFLFFSGVVVSPAEHNGIPCAGLRCNKTIKLFGDANNTKEVAIGKALNEVRKMGGMTSEIKARDLPVLLEALKAEGPFFRFRTSHYKPENAKPTDDPILVIQLRGKIDNYDGAEGSGGVLDNTGSPTDGGEAQGDDTDWDAVVAAANNEDGDAQTKLRETCQAMGMSEQEVEDAPDWEALAAYIKNGGAASGGTDDSAEGSEDWKPEVNDEVAIKLKGMKSAQKLKITKVNKTTIDLRNENTKKDFKGLKWTANPAAIDGVEI